MTSLVTRCPACATLFKVVPDQLRISEGWVRCGQCDEVFDAQAHMQPAMELVPEVPVAPESPAPIPESAEAVQSFAVQADAAHVEEERLDVIDDLVAPPAAPLQHPEPELVAEDAFEQEYAEASEDAPELSSDVAPQVLATEEVEQDDAGNDAPTDSVVDLSEVNSVTRDASPRFAQRPVTADDTVADAHPSFLKPVKRAGRPRWQWWLQGTVMLTLVTALVVQVALHQRERIVATEPAMEPVMRTLCQWAGCAIGPLRQIESVVIESSSFVKVKTDVYRLSFSVKNTAMVPLALPFAELTLTDLRDQSVLRRVVAPADYGARGETLAPGDELSVVVPLSVKATAGVGEKVTGYRLLVFYP